MACASVMPIITVTRVMCIAIGKRPATSTACATRGVRIEAMMDREGKCDCVYGYGGDSCDMPCTREDSCSSHGECVSGGYCVCDAGYEGEMCEKKESGYGVVIAILLVANCVVTYLWYRARVSNRGFLVRVSFPLIHISLTHISLTHLSLTHLSFTHSHISLHISLTHLSLTHISLTHLSLTHLSFTHSHISLTHISLTLTSHSLTSHSLTSHSLTSHSLTSHSLTSHSLTSHSLTSHFTSHSLSTYSPLPERRRLRAQAVSFISLSHP